jgi:hypothetical protein
MAKPTIDLTMTVDTSSVDEALRKLERMLDHQHALRKIGIEVPLALTIADAAVSPKPIARRSLFTFWRRS